MALFKTPNTRHGHDHKRTPRELWTERDQDQDDHSKPHCCGHCQASSLGDVGQGLI